MCSCNAIDLPPHHDELDPLWNINQNCLNFFLSGYLITGAEEWLTPLPRGMAVEVSKEGLEDLSSVFTHYTSPGGETLEREQPNCSSQSLLLCMMEKKKKPTHSFSILGFFSSCRTARQGSWPILQRQAAPAIAFHACLRCPPPRHQTASYQLLLGRVGLCTQGS